MMELCASETVESSGCTIVLKEIGFYVSNLIAYIVGLQLVQPNNQHIGLNLIFFLLYSQQKETRYIKMKIMFMIKFTLYHATEL